MGTMNLVDKGQMKMKAPTMDILILLFLQPYHRYCRVHILFNGRPFRRFCISWSLFFPILKFKGPTIHMLLLQVLKATAMEAPIWVWSQSCSSTFQFSMYDEFHCHFIFIQTHGNSWSLAKSERTEQKLVISDQNDLNQIHTRT